MTLKKGFALREVCGEYVIVGEGLEALDFGKLISVNETAAWLWKKAEEIGNFTIDNLVESLFGQFDVSIDRARIDVTNIVNEWISVGIVEADD